MNVDVHPEALLDREARGELTAEERVHLDAHLALCPACRLERGLREDFAMEFAVSSAQGNMQRLVSDALLAARALPAEEEPEKRAGRSPLWAGRRVAFALAATMLFISGLAFAQTELAMRVIEVARDVVGLPAPPAPVSAKPPKPKLRVRPVAKQGPTVLAAPIKPIVRVPELVPAQAPELVPARAEVAALGAQGVEAEGQSAVELSELIRPAQQRRRAYRSSEGSRRAPENAPSGEHASASAPLPNSANAPSLSVPASAIEQAALPQPVTPGASGLFEMAARAHREGRFSEAVLIYGDLSRRFPESAEGLTSLVVVARLELDRGNIDSALAGYDAYLRNRSRTLREQALVGRAQALHKLGRFSEAKESVRALKSEYPDAPYLELEPTRDDAGRP